MLSIEKLIESLSEQLVNKFVSKHVPWSNKKSDVSSIRFSKRSFRIIIDKIRKREATFLKVIAKRHKTLEGFFKDPQINPRANLSPKNKFKRGDFVSFTIECLPLKSQNILKNKSWLPDLAEAAMLIHFDELSKTIKDNFGITSKFILLVESDIYGELFRINKKVIGDFNKSLLLIFNKVITSDNITLLNWKEELSKLKALKSTIDVQKKNLNKLLEIQDPDTISEFLTIFPTIYMSIKAIGDATKIFINPSPYAKEVKTHALRTVDIALNVMAFNRSRKILCEREKLFQNTLRGTLTPAKGKWAFFAIGPWNALYPHHGVGLFDSLNDRVIVTYANNIKTNHPRKGRFIKYALDDIFDGINAKI